MRYLNIAETGLCVSNIAVGCMHFTELTVKQARGLIDAAQEQGINFFDHADIYGGGVCEKIFADAFELTQKRRETIVLQSKCGIVPYEGGAYYDFSKAHILDAAAQSLKRLKTEYLDLLLLHRPDTMMEPDEIAAAFDELECKGMVRHFGVSNFNPMQIELVQRAVRQPLAVNQLQLSVAHTPMIDTGLTVNMHLPQSVERTGNVLEYSRIKNMTIQAWSPLQRGFFDGPFLGDGERYPELNRTIGRIAQKYGVPETAVAIGWITAHPAKIQVVTGTTKIQRLADCCAGSELLLTRQEWYEIYAAAGNSIP